MTLVKHRPQRPFASPFDELFGNLFGRDISHFVGNDDVNTSIPRVNITETKDGFKLDLLAPGFSKEDLKMNVEDDTLTISAEKKSVSLNEGERYTRREFGYSAFKRGFRLPENVKMDSITANYANGVLTVSIAKSEPAKPAVREISIS
ncbi:MAG TPA: Hsp20/alpha crystallin family protein [Flavobacteriales bacterium]|nr:Hsp20/alpha crystallin family protein [Flavobacteriales bacterium]HNA33116.1 Hsp20/alpha crystallin family protein [Flavobacteriales bacterium]HNI03746.1 Hsp20/alpha crystallin family protein [Flavobacteriales bacterium]